MKNKVLAVVITLILSMSCAYIPAAASDFSSGLPEGWEIQQTVGGAEAYVENGVLALSCDNTESDARTAINVASESYSIGSSTIVIKTVMQISADSDTEGSEKRTFSIGSSGNALFSINARSGGGTVITALSGQEEFVFEKGVYHTITAAVDTENGLASVWCDEVNIYSGSAPAWASRLTLSDMRCYMLNRNTKYNGKSVWLIKSLSADAQAEYLFSSEPQNGQLVSEDCAAVAIDFNAYMSPAVCKSAVLQKKNGNEYENAAASAEKSDRGLKIIPEAGFLPMVSYRVVISGITDIFGNNMGDEIIEFKIASSGYTAPKIAAELNADELYEGQELTITARAEAEAGISEIALYINGAVVDSVKAEGAYYEYKYIYTPQYAGKFRAEIIVTDTAGGMACEEKSFTVKANTAPQITIDGIENGRTYNSVEQLSAVTVHIADAENNYESCGVYINGSLYAEYTDKDITLDLSGVTVSSNTLEIRARDTVGKSSSVTYEYYYVKTIATQVAYLDFESYTGGTPASMTNSASDKGGELYAVKIDSEHGTSLEVASQTDQAASDIGATVAYKYDTAGIISVEMDLYMPTTLATFRLRYRNADSGINLDIAEFARGGTINLLGTGGKVENGAELTYQPKTWYHISCSIETSTGVYDMYVNDKLLVSGRSGVNAGRIKGMSYLRMSLYTENGDGGSFVIDNLRITSVTELPRITAVTSPSGGEAVSYEDETIDVQLSAGISESNLLQHIALTNEIGKVGISEVRYYPEQKCVRITPAIPLISNTEYTVVLSGGIMTDTSIPIKDDMMMKFTTTKAAFDVESVRFADDDGGVSAAVEMINSASIQREVYIILTVWENNRLTASSAVSGVINGGSADTVIVPHTFKKGGSTVKLYVWSSLDGSAQAVSKKIFTN